MHNKKILRVTVSAILAASCSLASASALFTGSANATYLNIRASGSTDAAVLTSLENGTKFAVLNANEDWYKVAYNGVVGYVSGEYVTRVENVDINVGMGKVASDTGVNVRADNTLESEVVSCLEYGSTVSVIGVKGDWYKVQLSNTTGYIRNDFLEILSADQASAETSRDTVSKADALRNEVVNYAKQFLGTPYKYGGSSPKTGFDCSGFTSYVYKNTVRSIPRTSASQYSSLTHVKKSELKPGDLVFFGSSKKITHVGIYVGNGNFIHSPQTGDVIRIQSLSSRSNYVGAARVIFD